MGYWENRRARQMFEDVEEAEKLYKELAKAYLDARKSIQSQASGIFDKFQSKYGLTTKEAENLLKKTKDINKIKQLLMLDPKNKDLLMQIDSQTYGSRLARLNKINENIDTVVKPMLFTTVNTKMWKFFDKLAKSSYYQSIFDIQRYTGYGFSFKTLTKENVNKLLSSKWFGDDFSNRIWNDTEELADRLKHELLVDLLTGRPLKQAQDNIAIRFNASASNTRRLLRTETTYITNQMSLLTYENIGVKRYIYLATLDLRTSQICKSLDMKRFDVNNAQVGVNFPPMHPYCRSTTIADIPESLLEKLKRSAIDKDGNRIKVSGNMNYGKWYAKYVEGK